MESRIPAAFVSLIVEFATAAFRFVAARHEKSETIESALLRALRNAGLIAFWTVSRYRSASKFNC